MRERGLKICTGTDAPEEPEDRKVCSSRGLGVGGGATIALQRTVLCLYDCTYLYTHNVSAAGSQPQSWRLG